MSPTTFLLLMVAITVGAATLAIVADRARRAALRRLASSWHMHYTPSDRFRLAPRVASRLPVPGAAAVRVRDLIYGLEGDQLRYIFIVEYTAHTVSAQPRRQSVVTFVEARERREETPVQLWLAPEGMSVIEQYEHLRGRVHPAP